MTTANVLLLLFALQIKHLVCDFVLRPIVVYVEAALAGVGLELTGVLHTLTHSVATLIVLLVVYPEAHPLVSIALVEGLVHYFIDVKCVAPANKHVRQDVNDLLKVSSWWLKGFDQWLHGMTHIVIVAWIVNH